eukprot:5390715-Pyramimonas_sp.AAC.4
MRVTRARIDSFFGRKSLNAQTGQRIPGPPRFFERIQQRATRMGPEGPSPGEVDPGKRSPTLSQNMLLRVSLDTTQSGPSSPPPARLQRPISIDELGRSGVPQGVRRAEVLQT